MSSAQRSTPHPDGSSGPGAVAHENASSLAFDSSLGDVNAILEPPRASLFQRFLSFLGVFQQQQQRNNVVGAGVGVVSAVAGK